MAWLEAWLQQQLARRNLTRQAAAGHADVSGAILSDSLNCGNVLCLDILCCPATTFVARAKSSCASSPACSLAPPVFSP